MIALQLSSGQGPVECARAVTLAWQRLLAEAEDANVDVTLLEQVEGPAPDTHRSVVLGLEGDQATALARRWRGTVQWVCPSPYRKTGRKNWFLSAQVFDWGTTTSQLDPKDVRIEAMRSSGAGGQHVNKTSSAVRATHVPTGLTVRCDSERSQHANKRWALAWLAQKIQQADEEAAGAARATRRQAHHEVERGQGGRVFRGPSFLA